MKRYTFSMVPKNLPRVSVRPRSANFMLSHGGELLIMYQRTASAPYWSRMSKGSTVLPFDFDIFSPSVLTTQP